MMRVSSRWSGCTRSTAGTTRYAPATVARECAQPEFAPSAQAYLALSIDADLTSVFSWNTKLLFVYLSAEYATPLNELNQVRAPRRPRQPVRR